MSSFGLYLASVSVPIAQRVLTGLGFGVVTYTGLDALLTSAQNHIVTNWGLVGVIPMQLLSMAGVPDSINITLGALAARLTMMQLKVIAQIH